MFASEASQAAPPIPEPRGLGFRGLERGLGFRGLGFRSSGEIHKTLNHNPMIMIEFHIFNVDLIHKIL